MSDADLVERAREGDAAAFGELVDRHRLAVYRAARAALPTQADAEDAVQDAFLVAYQRLKTFRGDSSFKTWLLTIAWHQAINRRRSEGRWWRRIADTTRPMTMDAGHESPMDTAVASAFTLTNPSPEQQAVDDQLRQHIVAAIRALPPRLRDTLLLAQAGEHTYQEISAMLGAPLGTIKWRVSEARRVVRQALVARGHARMAHD